MVSKKEKSLIKDKINRSVHIKYKFREKIKNSMLRNNLVLKSKKKFLKINFTKSLQELRKKNICLISGENNTIKKRFLTSRFILNSLSIENKLQNFKINTW